MSTLLDLWSEPETTGIFTVLNNKEVPWKSENIYQSLNLAYYYNHSGQKNVSPMIQGIIGSDTTISDDNKEKIGNVVFSICNRNWQYEWDAMFTEYNPIENYNADETETNTGTDNTLHGGSDTNTRSGTDTHTMSGTDTTNETGTDTISESGTDTRKNTGTDSVVNSGDDVTKNTGTTTNTNTNKDGTSTTTNQIYGYNSSDPANDGKSVTTVDQTITDKREDDLSETITHGLTSTDTQDLTESQEYGKITTDTKNLSDSTTYGRSEAANIDISDTSTYNSSNNKTINMTRTLKRHGNIGVTTSQQMIESELELRKKQFFEIVFRDIDTYLTLNIY